MCFCVKNSLTFLMSKAKKKADTAAKQPRKYDSLHKRGTFDTKGHGSVHVTRNILTQ